MGDVELVAADMGTEVEFSSQRTKLQLWSTLPNGEPFTNRVLPLILMLDLHVPDWIRSQRSLSKTFSRKRTSAGRSGFITYGLNEDLFCKRSITTLHEFKRTKIGCGRELESENLPRRRQSLIADLGTEMQPFLASTIAVDGVFTIVFRRWVHDSIQADRAGGPGLRLAGIAGDSGVLLSLNAVRLRDLTNGTASGSRFVPR